MSDEVTRLENRASGPRTGMSAAPHELVGRTIDQRYRVEAVIGEGGMGLVYRVTHTRLNKTLAIKVIRRENTRDPEVVARFRREAESASAIGNQHIVDVSDFGALEDGSTYLVMECLQGMDLIEAMDRAVRMPEERAVRIAMQLCKALGAAHRIGIVHRDLKPENVFLTQREGVDDFVKVLDFGIAKVANSAKRITRAGEVLGTPHYMSPEQCEGEDVDHRTDIYSLGVLLYEMVTGHVPHDADTVMGILTKHMYEDPVPPRVRAPAVSDELQRLILRCLDKKPGRRYQSMAELETDLAPIAAAPYRVGPDTLTLTPPAVDRAKALRVSPMYLGGLAMALLAFAGALAVSLWLGDRQGEIARGLAPVEELSSAPSPARPVSPDPPSAPEEGSESALVRAGATAAPSAAARRAKPVRREPRPHAEPQKKHDTAILDPWE